MEKEIIKSFKQNDIVPRSISILVLAPLICTIIYKGGLVFTLFMMLLAILMFYEWYKVVQYDNFRWCILGVFYVLIPTICLAYLRVMDFWGTVWLIATVWAADIGAYLFGISFKGPKLCTKISPNKTWSGLMGAVVGAVAATYLLQYKLYTIALKELLLTAVILALLSQLGDLLESAWKRHFGVKNSGNIIPGHGGILDRVDGFTFAAPFMALLYW